MSVSGGVSGSAPSLAGDGGSAAAADVSPSHVSAPSAGGSTSFSPSPSLSEASSHPSAPRPRPSRSGSLPSGCPCPGASLSSVSSSSASASSGHWAKSVTTPSLAWGSRSSNSPSSTSPLPFASSQRLVPRSGVPRLTSLPVPSLSRAQPSGSWGPRLMPDGSSREVLPAARGWSGLLPRASSEFLSKLSVSSSVDCRPSAPAAAGMLARPIDAEMTHDMASLAGRLHDP